jgi:hypothetical protein
MTSLHNSTTILTGIHNVCDAFFEGVEFNLQDLNEMTENTEEWISSKCKEYEVDILKHYFEDCPQDIILNLKTVHNEIKLALPNIIAEKCLFMNTNTY